uniref:Uncharacterized protein n=1 Tax=Steinernema glaseri TaxID=37863 RepID=A0A1I8AUR7_9BILA
MQIIADLLIDAAVHSRATPLASSAAAAATAANEETVESTALETAVAACQDGVAPSARVLYVTPPSTGGGGARTPRRTPPSALFKWPRSLEELSSPLESPAPGGSPPGDGPSPEPEDFLLLLFPPLTILEASGGGLWKKQETGLGEERPHERFIGEGGKGRNASFLRKRSINVFLKVAEFTRDLQCSRPSGSWIPSIWKSEPGRGGIRSGHSLHPEFTDNILYFFILILILLNLDMNREMNALKSASLAFDGGISRPVSYFNIYHMESEILQFAMTTFLPFDTACRRSSHPFVTSSFYGYWIRDKYDLIWTRTRVMNTSASIRIRTGKEDSVDSRSDRNPRSNENANCSVMVMVTSTIYRPI